ncbi:vacuolar protein sorting-associated protein 54, chloroplastic [Phoenix dactylifera]|uniref:Vacuolar protein sorting-associated protein 54, chloroplastic n=1 Tax=Phoenix dactylifera TaxID=42345 RepID=A0A8B9A7P7_PHODC|nr:vacuolar protein sorting-associated protein 54, chloroplastic [Phoenix dactylifera]XP_038982690.1 vacuolar protein sorting-associated protein 54, chloroplastic [Phoenix dactylifera]XP_038982691.1 vacuolar protein sorting-associated protein 54, chloroplastic [Phoenix dactylifera]XP_038982692.1 vacuolar protein sorting-associated protein 54, chloroplastic [Phoenix dactylifera]XP_038982693.1 vacuolar protein sorting-associated protein 54, chloroplastic [Phoenix dactylifera]XP_038982694.1 vacuo
MEAPPSQPGRAPLRTAADGLPRSRDPINLGRSSSASSRSDFDSPSASAAAVSQSLSSILNNPHAGRSDAYWSLWWPSASAATADLPPPLVPSIPLPEVIRADFQPYLSAIFESYSRFEDVRNHSSKETAAAVGDGEIRGQGEALVACLREVPSLFFKEDFALEEGTTFQAACPFSPSAQENTALQERLTQYLDVVEMHLVREISLRSDSFFEAQGQLQGLNGEIVEACVRIRELKEAIRILIGDLVGTARQVQELNATRGNLVALQQKLSVILYVSQALSALKLLVAAADCAGALDVTDDLQHLLDTDELAGLHCFRHLRDQLATSLDSINSILSAEFLHAAINDAKINDKVILSKLKTKAASLTNGMEDEVKLDDDESSILRDHLLPLIICLLRTGKLPAVLRIYRDALITDMKAAIKTTVAELLPVLVARPLDSDFVSGEQAVDSDGGGLSLASKLRSLSSESFVQLLAAIFKVIEAHLMQAAEVKRVIEWIMGNLDGCYATDSVAVAVAHGAAAAAAAEAAQESDTTVVPHISLSLPRNAPKLPLFQGKTNDGSSPNTSKNFRADVLRENTEAVFAACDAAHGRWAKLLGVRALLHPRLRLQEFLSIYNITQDFIAATEKIGGRLGYSIRGTLQSQSKAFVDFQHESRMTKIKAVLDQETWVTVDVPGEFQAIVVSLSSVDNGVLGPDSLSSEMVESGVSSGEQHFSMNVSGKHGANPSNRTLPPSSNQENRAEPTPSVGSNMKEHGRFTSQTLMYGGIGYHMVNCGLILLKMLSEYVDISKCLPSLSSEVVHRVVEILKLFNTRTCQLVLGAGAMQVSGLKSITSKHLALASQIISFIYAIIPDIRRVLFSKIPEARKALLMSEIDRVAQDYKIHRDEIHTKLVQIMRERLLANLRKLPQIVESWDAPEDNDLQPSQFARSVTKEVMYLHRILSQTLLEADVQAIFRQVIQIFHSHISESFSKLDVSTPQAKNRLCRDVQHILECIHKLPSDNSSKYGVPNFGLLDEFLAEKFETKVGQ